MKYLHGSLDLACDYKGQVGILSSALEIADNANKKL